MYNMQFMLQMCFSNSVVSSQQHTSEIYIFFCEQDTQQTDVYAVIIYLCSLDSCYIDII